MDNSPLAIGQRIKLLRKHLRQSQGEFAEHLGFTSNAAVSQWETGKNDINPKTISKIVEVTKVSREWLLHGTGLMFGSNLRINTDEPTASGLKIPHQFRSGQGDFKYLSQNYMKILPVMVDLTNTEVCTVVPIKARAGYKEGFTDTVFLSQLPYETVPLDLQGKGTIRKFEVEGDSMEKEIKSGDWVYASYVEFYNAYEIKQVILHKYVYVINTLEGLFIKRLEFKTGESGIWLISDNKNYPAEFLPFDKFLELWRVRRVYSAQIPESVEETELMQLINELKSMRTDLTNVTSRQKGIEAALKRIEQLLDKK